MDRLARAAADVGGQQADLGGDRAEGGIDAGQVPGTGPAAAGLISSPLIRPALSTASRTRARGSAPLVETIATSMLGSLTWIETSLTPVALAAPG